MQVTGAVTTHVGCGFAQCSDLFIESSNSYYRPGIFIVCNYGPWSVTHHNLSTTFGFISLKFRRLFDVAISLLMTYINRDKQRCQSRKWQLLGTASANDIVQHYAVNHYLTGEIKIFIIRSAGQLKLALISVTTPLIRHSHCIGIDIFIPLSV